MPTLATPTTLTTLTLAPFTLLLLDLRLLLFIILCLLTTSGASNRSQELPPWDEQVSCHVCSGACVVWSDGDPRIEVGARGWVAVAKHHSMLLQKVRSIGPLVSGLMGMDMCVGCCQMKVHQRLTAEQTANHPFVLSCLTWSAEIEMISGLAPLLRHMPPGDVRGHGSHEWMLTTLPATLQEGWALEMIGSMIKYPFVVEICVELASSLKPDYPAEQLVDVLLETVIRAATRAALGSKGSQRRRGQMAALDAQGVCRFLGLPRIMQKLGLLKKLAPQAAEALSHRFRGRIRRKWSRNRNTRTLG